MNMDVRSKSDWISYVQTAQLDAGEFLKVKNVNPAKVEQVKQSHWYPFRPVILNYTDNSWNWGSWGRPVTQIHHHHYNQPATSQTSRKEREEEKKQKEAEFARIVGSILVIAGGFLTGLLYTTYSRYNQTHNNTVAVDKELDRAFNSRMIPNPFPGRAVKTLLGEQKLIDSRNIGRVRNYGLAALTFTSGAAAMATGGFAVIPAYILAGKIATIASLAFAAINCGLHWYDKEDNRKSYEKIIVQADSVLTQLHALNEDLTTPQQAYQNYSTQDKLYPDLSEYFQKASAPNFDQ